MSYVFVLGAPDPEMVTIQELLNNTSQPWYYALYQGCRVGPDTAYKCNRVVGIDETPRYDTVVLVECGGPGLDICMVCGQTASGRSDGLSVDDESVVGGLGPCGDTHRWPVGSAGGPIRVDHHRLGDPGYGVKPQDFLRASSVGQVISHLANTGVLRFQENEEVDPSDGPGLVPLPAGRFFILRNWRGSTQWLVAVGGKDAKWLVVPKVYLYVAAADHCLAAAYRGECPGVDPDGLMRWRVASRSLHQGRSESQVLADIETARELLRNLRKPGDEYVDLRDHHAHIPELPEAAAREGIPFIATVPSKDGRKKVVLQAASQELVRRFLSGEIVPSLDDLYGDPARGFAGGYTAV